MGLSQDENVESNNFRCLKDFDFLASILVGGGGCNGNEGGSLSVGSGI